MRYWDLNGFLMVLIIQHCTSEGVSTSIQTFTEVSNQTFPQEAELPAAETVPVVSPPSLKDVQQAVLEASEQVEGRGAEEVLKELLERVVEAALGQAEGGSDTKDVAVQEMVEEDTLRIQREENNAKAGDDISEKPLVDENIDPEEGYAGSVEEQEAVEADVPEDITEEGKEAFQVESQTSLETSTESEKTRVGKVKALEVTNESLGAEFSQKDAMKASEETDGDLEAGEAGDEDSREQVVLSEGKKSAETEIEAEAETQLAVEEAVGGQPDQETLKEAEASRGGADEKLTGNDWGKEVAQEEMEGETTVLPSNDFKINTTQSVVGESADEEEGLRTGGDAEGQAQEQGYLVESRSEKMIEEGRRLGEAAEDGRGGDDKIKDAPVRLVGEEDEDALENSYDGNEETQEILVISGPQPDDGEAFVEQSPENKPATSGPSLEEMESRENSDSDNKLIIPHQATPDDSEEEALQHIQTDGDEQREADELMEDIPGIKEAKESNLEPWKIGAIFAGVFLVLETIVIIIYILKCQNQKSGSVLQKACEEGCVEPEQPTGGDCSDDTLPAANGDTQQLSLLEPSDMVSTLAKQKEQQQDELAISTSDLSPSSTQELTHAEPQPDPSQDLRTSM